VSELFLLPHLVPPVLAALIAFFGRQFGPLKRELVNLLGPELTNSSEEKLKHLPDWGGGQYR
jgi:hypothetical protein